MSRSGPLTVMYHGVVPDTPLLSWASFGVIGQSDFERQIRLLKRTFHILHPDEFLEGLRKGRAFDRRSALITLDDGFQNVLDYALPVAEYLRTPLLAFICDGPMDGGEWLWFCRMLGLHLRRGTPVASLISELSPLKLDEVELRLSALAAPLRSAGADLEHTLFDGMDTVELRQAVGGGFLTPGGHTTHHPNLLAESAGVVEAEIRRNKERLEVAVGVPMHFFAYPGGYVDPGIAMAVRACGYDAAFVVDPPRVPVPEGLQRYFLPRAGIYRPGIVGFLGKTLRARWQI